VHNFPISNLRLAFSGNLADGGSSSFLVAPGISERFEDLEAFDLLVIVGLLFTPSSGVRTSRQFFSVLPTANDNFLVLVIVIQDLVGTTTRFCSSFDYGAQGS
jgi:hypothetical protein